MPSLSRPRHHWFTGLGLPFPPSFLLELSIHKLIPKKAVSWTESLDHVLTFRSNCMAHTKSRVKSTLAITSLPPRDSRGPTDVLLRRHRHVRPDLRRGDAE